MATSPAPLGAYSVDPDPDSVAGRRLAAGTYRDRDLRDQVLRDIYNAYGRRIAPSHGFDLVLVIRHAWTAWWLETGQQLLLLGVLGCWFAVRPLDAFIALDLLALSDLLRRWLSWVLEYLGYGGRRDPTRDRPEQVRERNLSIRGKLLKRLLAAALAVLAALLLMSAASRQSRISAASWATATMFTVAGIMITLVVVLAVTAAVRARRLARLRFAIPCRKARSGAHAGHRAAAAASGYGAQRVQAISRQRKEDAQLVFRTAIRLRQPRRHRAWPRVCPSAVHDERAP